MSLSGVGELGHGQVISSTNQLVGGVMGDRRAEIVQAAFRQVATVGFEGLRLREIAADVGIDHSTLHHHFPGKKEIVAGVAEYAIGLTSDAGSAGTLRGYLAHLASLLERAPEVFVVTAELDLRARRDPVVREVMARHLANWRASLRQLFEVDGSVGDVDGGVELVIAAVKGVQLAPETAGVVFGRLAGLLVG
ncbi:TetR/AcrR family transcriptional regulator [Kibdelosporangium lantanae]|uniref:TetR/AcrR family transcriptional regulator n=1 Tax=Kibdelosporangium lantanae TaxID=1497396 RepID=A0ABW3MGB0_9PSEU